MAADLETLNAWLILNNHPPTVFEDLPTLGFVAQQKETPVAVGFLNMCEGRRAVLEGLSTNPYADSDTRHFAINSIVEQIISAARLLGVYHLIAWTIDDNILKRSENFGFKIAPHKFIALELGE
jgi:hypothetical protein